MFFGPPSFSTISLVLNSYSYVYEVTSNLRIGVVQTIRFQSLEINPSVPWILDPTPVDLVT